MERKNAWSAYAGEAQPVEAFAKAYRAFLDAGKTERECVKVGVEMARATGFRTLSEATEGGRTLEAGDRIYFNWMNKVLLGYIVGREPMERGMNILGAHIDSPRIDVKQNPLYEDTDLSYLDTHYYGGIKKYQWTTIPMSLHGVIVKGDGTKVTVNIGDDAGDPQFVVTDLLPHLGAEQNKRSLGQGIKGEELNLLIGSLPFNDDEESENVKLNIMSILNEKYGIIEKDFQTAELEIVPAFAARDIGFDRSLIGAYGHDDKVCSYPAAMANFALDVPEYTAVTILTDKEEIGSDGNTGLNSSYLKFFIMDLAENAGVIGHDVLSKSECLSADVTAAYDPTFPEPMEKRNAAFCNKGVCIMKYTGSRGKSGTSDATAEFFGKVRGILDSNNIVWQTGELGKVDAGGGGTVAMYVANLDVDVIDIGTPVLSMHSPFEVISKLDLYSTYQAALAFFQAE